MSREQKFSRRFSDEDFRHSLGKIDKLKLMEPLYRKALTENERLKAKLRVMEKTNASDQMSADVSITEHLLNSANIKDLDHPTEFFEVLDKEKQEEIELLKEKARSSKRDIEKVKQQKDDLALQADDLRLELSENDEKMKALEETLSLPATDEGDGSSRREREEALRRLRLIPTEDHSMRGRRRTTAEQEEKEEEEDLLQRKIEELQQRVTELQNHNDKWKALCKELHQELNKVKSQLQKYQKAETSDGEKMMVSLRDEEVRTEKAERMALTSKRQIEEFERKVIDLEKQLAEKELRQREQEQDRIKTKVEEAVREETMHYEEKLKTWREDFESERNAHVNTKTQLNYLRQRWQSVYDQMKDVAQRLSDTNQQLETLKKENEELEFQLEQAGKDRLLIRNRLSEFGLTPVYNRLTTSDCTAKVHPDRFALSVWDCHKCTFRNGEKSVNCEMCNEPYKNEQFTQHALPEIPFHLTEELSATKCRPEEDGIHF